MSLVSQNLKDSTSFYKKSITEVRDAKATAKAFEFFEYKAKIAEENTNVIKASYYTELISLGQFKMGLFYESEANTIKALSLLDQLKNNTGTLAARQRLTNQLGMIYRNLEDFDNAFRFYDEALKLNVDINAKIAIILNVANIHADKKDYKKAVSILKKYYDSAFNIDKVSIKAHYFDNYGYYQTKNGDLSGLNNMQLALSIRSNYQDLTGLFSSYRHLSKFYSDQGNRSKALKYANLAQVMSDSINSPSYQLEALGLKLKLENQPSINKYISINNQINKAKLLRENEYAAIKYNIAEKDRIISDKELEIKGVELDFEKQKRFKLTYMLIGCLLFISSIGIYFILKIKHKKENIQQVYNTETRISKKVHDEVANDIYHVMNKLQSKDTKNEHVLDDLELIYSKTRDISKESGIIDLTENFNELLDDLLQSFHSNKVTVITKGLNQLNWSQVNDLKKTAIYRVLQELMTNMKKHSKATIVVLKFEKLKDNIHINYNDNGVGCPIKKHNGLQNAENRIVSLNGTITFESEIDKGFKVKITM
ncbi:tetratricopeptide repeat protein [uncultured Algibacter sp.]|uniref:tetratricopeptide repeat-containing sensor histidine kinase n=1 Tax=uncultured Algibacter sp. TaxID=298659 RepID=UPI0026145722|nr:tetratricopeptide repeat protein [uncultured Algibacter sp.]